jgi:hypothetical protein
MSRKMIRTLASTLALGLLLVACGQHSGVHVEGDPAAGGAQQDDGMGGTEPTVDGDGMAVDDDGEPSVGDGDGEIEVDDNGEAATPTNGNGEATASGNGEDGEEAGGDGEQQEQQQQQQEPQGQDRTGVDDDTISIAVHAPVTGAAPLPSQAFEQAGDLYWRWVIEEQGEEVLGRTNIEIEFADDRYEPATARQVCRELMSRNFAVVGGGGTDGIQACGELAGRDRVPYFSPGVTEAGLSGNPWYFPASMTYRSRASCSPRWSPPASAARRPRRWSPRPRTSTVPSRAGSGCRGKHGVDYARPCATRVGRPGGTPTSPTASATRAWMSSTST